MKKYCLTLDKQTNSLWEDSYDILGDVSIMVDNQDGLPPYFTFSSVHLDELISPNEIWSRALSLLNVYNGARNLYFDPQKEGSLASTIKLKRLFNLEDDRDITPERSYEIVQSFPYSNSLISSDYTKGSNSKLSRAIHLSKSNQDILDILLLLGVELNWVTLYSILDTVKHYSTSRNKTFFSDVLSKIENGESKLKAFTGTANNFGLLGVQARHGMLGLKTPSKTLTLIEAQSFVISLCNEYLFQSHSIK